MPELSISTDKVEFLIVKAREFDVKESITDPGAGSNGADDDMIDVLEDDGCEQAPIAAARQAQEPARTLCVVLRVALGNAGHGLAQ